MDPKGGPHRPASRAGRVPRHAHAGLPERDGVVLNQRRLANVRLGEDESGPVIGVIGGVPVDFIPSCGHLVPQAQANCEIRAELDFILEIPGNLRGAEVQRRRTWGRLELLRVILQHVQQGAIGERARVILNR